VIDQVPAREEVAENRSTACWTVEESAWKQVLPDLPDDVIALLATPVVVAAEPCVDVEPEASALPAVPPVTFLAPGRVGPNRGAHRGPARGRTRTA
jgi:hypothetical protein